MTTKSITISHRMVTITRSPRIAYGIHISAWVQARRTAVKRAGQINGMLCSVGHIARGLMTIQSAAMEIVP